MGINDAPTPVVQDSHLVSDLVVIVMVVGMMVVVVGVVDSNLIRGLVVMMGEVDWKKQLKYIFEEECH